MGNAHGSVVVVSALTRYALLYSVCNLIAALMNIEGRLIQELIRYEYELDDYYIVFYGFINEIIKQDLRNSINETKHISL